MVVEWTEIHQQLQQIRVWSLGWEEPYAMKQLSLCAVNYWAQAPEPMSHNCWAHKLQLRKSACLEPLLRNKRNYHSMKTAHHHDEQPPLTATREEPAQSRLRVKSRIIVTIVYHCLTYPYNIWTNSYCQLLK